MRHPRIAVVAPSNEQPGGQSIQAQHLVAGLCHDGYEVKFVPINPRFPIGLQWLRGYPYARTILNQTLFLPNLLCVRTVDVVHVFSASYWSFLLSALPAILIARVLKKRVVLNYHSGEAAVHLARWGALIHPWLRLVDHIVVPSEYLRTVFRNHGYDARVVPNVVDTSKFRFRERNPVRPRLLSTRNFEPHYRLEDTLKAFALLKTRYGSASLTMAGQGSEEGRIRDMAVSQLVRDVYFPGSVSPEAMPDLYAGADIFVNSSVIDNQPVSVLEAFAAGLPVVSTGIGGIAGMVTDGENGLLIPVEDPAAMAGAVAMLVENPQWAALIARRAREHVERYTWAQVSKCWAEVYEGERTENE